MAKRDKSEGANNMDVEENNSPIVPLKWYTKEFVVIKEIEFGDGLPIKLGQTAYVLFEIYRADKKKLLVPRSTFPIKIQLGQGKPMIGLDIIIKNMKAGGKRRGKIPFNLAVASDDVFAGIPPGVDIVCEVELVRFM